MAPTYNEQENVPVLYKKLTDILSGIHKVYDYEIIFVDDGSRDATWSILTDIAAHDERVNCCKFSRNFGHQSALTAGYDRARGDCVVTMDADLQDPPELILEMIKFWERGIHIVYARRIHRSDRFLKRMMACSYYRIMTAVSDVAIPRNVGDFRLVDRVVLAHIQRLKEKSRYLRGLVAWMGYTCAYVDFERPNRTAGISGYSWKKMCQLGFDGLTSFSLFPLRLIGYIGCSIILCSMIIFVYLVYQLSTGNASSQSWLVLCGLMAVGIQSTALWVLGEYVGRIYKEILNRPLYIVEDSKNNSQKISME